MLAKTLSVALVGADAHLVEVEVHATQGVPNFTVVGLPAKSVREAEQRTRSALLSSDQRWPPCRTVANLAPASLRKEGTHFDLAIAMGILAADRRLDPAQAGGWVFVGELSLDGSVRPVRGVLPAAIAARRSGCRGLVCPARNAGEASLVDDLTVVPVETLGQGISFLRNAWSPPPIATAARDQAASGDVDDMSEVRGQPFARAAVEVAAAGGHNLLMEGSPGCGKTMIARRLPGILPPMSKEEALDVTRVHSVAGLIGEDARLVDQRPFRTPHHNVSVAGLVGGGPGLPRPGEAVLAHHGVLFLDELPLFRRDVLESLRGPLEDGAVRIARSAGVVTFPCKFSLVAAMNPCPCGHGSDSGRCRCPLQAIQAYKARVSGPLLDRFDLQLGMTRLDATALLSEPPGESSAAIRSRVELARARQRERYESPTETNANVTNATIRRRGRFRPEAFEQLHSVIDRYRLTGRGVDRVLRVARTVADLEGDPDVQARHVDFALGLRGVAEPAEVAA
ncbi:MAG TPA: YifB family Mg chelatase-like AAA ATPase [Actinomycetota bacterium]|nr:YifB family Mg chelatase-like AAA ATPase [Actinomycetota bacterium]